MSESFYQESLSSAETTGGFTPGSPSQEPPQLLSELRVTVGSSSSATVYASTLSPSSLNGEPASIPDHGQTFALRLPQPLSSAATPSSAATAAFPVPLRSDISVDALLLRKPKKRPLTVKAEDVGAFKEVLRQFQEQDYFHTISKTTARPMVAAAATSLSAQPPANQ